MAITQVISALPTPPKIGVDVEAVFVQKGEALFDAIHDTLQPEINTVSTQMNTVAGEVQANTTLTQTNKNTVVTDKATVLTARDATLASEARVNALVPITGTSYSTDALDTKISAKYVASGTINKQDDANIFKTVVGNEYKMANTDRFVNFDGNVMDAYGDSLIDENTTYVVANATHTQVGENHHIVNTAVASGSIYTSNLGDFTVGKDYLIRFTINEFDNNSKNAVRVFAQTDGTLETTSSYGEQSIKFSPTVATQYIRFYLVSTTIGDNIDISNISVREITTVDMTDMIPEVIVQDQATNGLVVQSSVNAGDYVVVDKQELVTNGTFETVTDGVVGHDNGDGTVDGWNAVSGASLSIEANKLKVLDVAAASNAWAELVVITEIGATYTVSAKVEQGTNTNFYMFAGTTTASGSLYDGGISNVFGTYTYTFTATTTVSFLSFGTYNASTYTYFDNISVQLKSDIYRAKQTAPALTSLTNTTYYENRTQFGITNKILATRRNDGTIKTEVCFIDTAIEDCGNAHVVMTDNGYSKLSNGLYSKGTDIVTPVGTWSTLNKGAYHPFFNAFGTRTIYNHGVSASAKWFNDLSGGSYNNFIFNGTAITFGQFSAVADSVNIPYSGYIGSTYGSGHPQGKFYNIIYPDQWIDLRIEANAVSEQDELNRVGTKAKSGQLDGIGGVVKANYSINVVTYNSTYNVTYIKSLELFDNAENLYETSGTLLTGVKIYDSNGVEYIVNKAFIGSKNIEIDGNKTAEFATGKSFILSNANVNFTVKLPVLPHPSSGTALRTRMYGNPSSYPTAIKDRLASGLPLIGIEPILVSE